MKNRFDINIILAEDERKEKKKQSFLHGQLEFRQRQQKEKEEQRLKEESEDKLIRDEIEKDPQAWYLKIIAQKQVYFYFLLFIVYYLFFRSVDFIYLYYLNNIR